MKNHRKLFLLAIFCLFSVQSGFALADSQHGTLLSCELKTDSIRGKFAFSLAHFDNGRIRANLFTGYTPGYKAVIGENGAAEFVEAFYFLSNADTDHPDGSIQSEFNQELEFYTYRFRAKFDIPGVPVELKGHVIYDSQIPNSISVSFHERAKFCGKIFGVISDCAFRGYKLNAASTYTAPCKVRRF
jgi:hypothetical protein